MPNWTDEQKQAIIEDGKSIIVSAGAGSGKTAVLSERVLQKLKKGINIDELLVLTFTNAAALEMKERIRKKIMKDSSLIKQLEKLDNAYITTFDSYALSIVKKYNYLLNVSKDISIIEQNIIDIKKNEIIDELFDELYKNNDINFLKLIDDMCTKDDIEIKNYIIDINNKLDMIYDKSNYLNNYIEKYYSDEFVNSKIKDYEELVLNNVSKLNKLIIELEDYVEMEYYENVNGIIGELLISANYNSVKSNLVSLPNLPKNSSDEAKEIKEKISELLKKITNLCVYEDTDEIRKSIYKTKDIVGTIIYIITLLDKRINDYKYENDLYEFNDIAKMAIKVLENEEVRKELKYNEILIDEYQDTNDLQDLFISYIADNNVYMVGDIKQSIYRFRNANPNLFKTKYDNYSKNDGGMKIDLNKNFRSREEVLNNINEMFNLVMDDKIGGADYIKSHQMIFGNNDYSKKGKTTQDNNIEILNYEFNKESLYKKEEIEIFTIARDIQNKMNSNYQIFDKDTGILRNVKYSDMAILMDRSTNFDLYKKIFEYLNIPLTIYRDESITNSVDISIIKNIINLYITKEHNQSFKYSFISISRSYLYNINDNEIFRHFASNSYDTDLINKISELEAINPKELVINIIDKFDFYSKIITVGDVEKHIVALDYLVDLAGKLTDMGYTIKDFYNYLEEIIDKEYDINYKSKKSTNGVKIMTIHASKGLEYPICYYSGLYAKFNISDLKERFIYNNKYGIITPYFENGIRNTIYKDLLKQDYLLDEISEKVRLFYVALTRAREKIIIIVPNSDNIEINEDVKISYSSFLDIINSIRSKFSLYTKNIDIDALQINRDYNFVKKYNYQDNIRLTNDKIEVNELKIENNIVEDKHFSKINNSLISKEERINMKLGKQIHAILENIDFNNPDYSSLNEFELRKVSKFINSGILNDVINIYKEHEFIYTVDNTEYHGIIDLLLEYEHEFKIIDYKLKNITDDAYLEQLNGYKKYVESISNKKVSIYLYSIIDEKLISVM